MPANNTTRKQVSILSVLEIVRRRMLFVAVPAVLAAAAVVAFALYMPVRYRGDVLLGISSAPDLPGSDAPAAHVQDQLLTIREALFSREVLEPVANEFKLYPAGAGGKLSDADLEDFKNHIKIQIEGEDSFHLTYDGPLAPQAMNVTNRTAETFVRRLSGLRRQQVSNTAQVLGEDLALLSRKLTDQEQRIRDYKERSVNALPDRLDTNLRQLENAQTERQLRMDRRANDQARLAAVKEELSELEKQGVMEPAVREKTPNELKLDDMRLQLRQLQSKYTDSYPDIERLKEEVQNLERVVAAAPVKARNTEPSAARLHYTQLKGEQEQIEQRLRGYAAEDRAADAQLGQLQNRVQATPAHESAIAGLTRDYETTKSRYNDLLAKQQEARLASRAQASSRGVGFRIIEPASLPTSPASPARSRLLLMGLFASLGLGLVAAFVAEQMDTSFDSVDAFQEFTDLPLLCGLPSVSGAMRQSVQPRQGSVEAFAPHAAGHPPSSVALPLPALYRNRVVSLTDPHAVASEQYRILALKIRKQLGDRQSPVIAITSSIGGEGKTLTSLNVAFALAATSPRPVLLLESDLRKPRLHEYLGLRPTKGFSDLLLNPDSDLAAHLWKIKGLFLMPGGTSLSNPVELLTSPATRRVLERLRAEFGFIVMDAPPVLPIVDTHIIAGLVDGVVVVVRARYTRRELFQRAMESFQVSNLIGAAVNDIDYERSRYSYAYKYYSKNYLSRA